MGTTRFAGVLFVGLIVMACGPGAVPTAQVTPAMSPTPTQTSQPVSMPTPGVASVQCSGGSGTAMVVIARTFVYDVADPVHPYSYLDLNELRARSIPYADRLAARASAAVRVGVMHGSSVVVVHHVFRPDTTFGVLEVGLQLPLHASSLGKAILAFSPNQVIDDLLSEPLPRLTKQTLDETALRGEMAAIRDQSVATERDEAVLGESSAAAPIFDHVGSAVGAIGVVDATERIFPRGLAKGLSAAVSEAARAVSRELGAPRWPHAAEA